MQEYFVFTLLLMFKIVLAIYDGTTVRDYTIAYICNFKIVMLLVI